jgi:phosphoglycerate dehydrogenase-like enzyme
MPANPDVFLLHQAADEADRIRDAFDASFDRDVTLRVAETPEDSLSAIEDAEVVLTVALSDEQLDAAESLEWVQAMNAGVDTYPTDRLAERGVTLTNSSGIHAEQIGQQVLGYLLLFERRIYEGMRQQRAGEWSRYDAGELGDETLGVVGLGAIGGRVAEFGQTMGMDVVGTKRDPSTAPAAVDDCYPPEDLAPVLDRSDYLVVACPLTDETRGLIGEAELARLDDDAVLVNIARGPIVDQDALIAALRDDTLRGAALDVSDPEPMPEDSPLRSMPNVVMTPHVAGSTPYYFDRAVELFARNYRAYVEGDPLENVIV